MTNEIWKSKTIFILCFDFRRVNQQSLKLGRNLSYEVWFEKTSLNNMC